MSHTQQPVVVRGLEKTYGSFQAVDGIDLAIEPGEVFALLGPNGAGKTTTIEILEGIRSRSKGEVSVLGEDPARRKRRWRGRIGVVPQTTGIYLDLSVGEVLRQFASYYAAPLDPAHVIEMVGLTKETKKQASDLSGGQQRRLDVAVGIVGDPELIFLDEPTTGLDPVARREAWDLIRYFADRGKTTILTTHYLDEAEELAHRAAVIVDGKIKAMGTIAELNTAVGSDTTISFRCPSQMRNAAIDWPRDCKVSIEETSTDDTLMSVSTSSPSQTLRRLLAWGSETGVSEVPDLRVHRASLEDIYIELIKK